jgi:holo-[acyl-carrier protein] synthase
MKLIKQINKFGIGTDIESISRFIDLDKSFLKKIFTKHEIEYCFSKQNIAPCLAARYAGKEAVVKALSSIGISNMNYKQIEILKNAKGIPTVRINNIDFNNLVIYISLSHCNNKAISFAIVMEADRHKQHKDS